MIAAWMVYALAVSVPLAAATAVAAALLRRRGKPERWTWVAGIVASLTLPLALMAGFDTGAAPSGSALPDISGAVPLPGMVAVPESGWLTAAGPVLLVLWALATAVLAVRTVVALRRLRREARAWSPARVADASVLLTPDLGPAVYGVLDPRIVLPRRMAGLPEEQLRLIVRHEAEHIRAGDPWLLAGSLVLRTLLPWHLPVLWMTGGLRAALELDCDRRVTRAERDVARYGETVLAVAALGFQAAHPLPAFTESTRFIKKRIIAMSRPTRTLGGIALLAIAAAAVLAVAGACGMPLPTDSWSEEQPPEVQESSSAVEPTTTATETSAGPTFTPFTVAPSIVNREEVVAAMEKQYPPLLREAGIGGTVRVYFFINEEGTVEDTRIQESSGHEALDQAALNVAATYRFAPALNRDEPVPVWVVFPITFQVT